MCGKPMIVTVVFHRVIRDQSKDSLAKSFRVAVEVVVVNKVSSAIADKEISSCSHVDRLRTDGKGYRR